MFRLPVTLAGRMRATALLVACAMLALAAYTASTYYTASIEQRLIATRAVVQQSLAIAQKYHEQQQAGTLGAAEAQARAQAEIKQIRYDGKEYVWINDMTPRMVAHPIKPELDGKDLSENKDPNGKRLFVEFVNVVRASGSGYVDYLWPKPGSDRPEPKRSFVAGFAPWGWVIGSGVYVDEVRNAALHFAAVSLGIGALISAGVFLCLHLMARTMRRRLGEAQAALEAIAEGRLDTAVATGGADEIGRLLAGVERTRASLRSALGQVRQATGEIATASSEIASGNHDLSNRTESTASSLQQTAAAMEQMAASVQHNAESSRTAARLATDAAAVAERGGDAVRQVVRTMDGIHGSSQRIGEITGVIDGIAFQTNILALNAAVEAARAGEQGRGFAVVAAEVRSLAQRSAEAAKEIKQLIGDSSERIAEGTRQVDDAGRTMGEIVAQVQRVSSLIAEITSANGQQSSGVAQIGAAVGDLDRSTQQNAALVEQSAAAAESMKQQAARLDGVVAGFRL